MVKSNKNFTYLLKKYLLPNRNFYGIVQIMVEIKNFKIKIIQNASLVGFGYSDNQWDLINPVSGVTNNIDEYTNISVTQFAREAHITPQAVRKMIVERRLSAKKVGEQYIIERQELKRYLENK